MSLNVGVIGLGFGGQVLIPAIRRVRGLKLSAIAASTAAGAEIAAKRLGVGQSTGDWRELADDPNLDALVIAVPPDLQAVIAARAARNSKAIFCEKPLAPTARAAQALAASAQKRRLSTAVDFEFPELKTWSKAGALLRSGAIGELRDLQITWNVQTYAVRHDLNSWKTSAKRGGGALNAFASHIFHGIELYAGRIDRIYARLTRANGLRRARGETAANLILKTRSGVTVSANVVTHAPGEPLHRWLFVGSKGTLILENHSKDYMNGFFLSICKDGSVPLRLIEQGVDTDRAPSSSREDGRIAPAAKLMGRWAAAVRNGKPCSPGFAEGARVQALIEAARHSAASGREISCG